MERQIVIGHLFPELLNLYGDLGNITTLVKRCQWRGIEVTVKNYTIGHTIPFNELDIILLGGGSDREQRLVCDYLRTMKNEIKDYVENNGVFLAICGGYQLLGSYYKTKNTEIPGLEILDLYTEQDDERLIGNVLIQSTFGKCDYKVVGFENHSGRTYHDYEHFGNVVFGHGNNDEDHKEGLLYKNVLGTYLHGPLLPKNPEVADALIEKALDRKYGESYLEPLENRFEKKARAIMIARLEKGEL
ncbi:glutamine amidotransferase [endosymbiont 'TC1' of Trimyema compressum]|uniref:type 1 glutamine amidotransferase n=1 Tax=endosymbiont 'TC1' of Trimyema compressum TaxID=243899 RepID=UPI0007F05055|nr:glutamine amidotransferase [endosymbiont 'TC1' of Trimyema compressum]AMP21392.1 glutamine amidotransferase [endosymbiont 'TC1' of Trimyema compressum]